MTSRIRQYMMGRSILPFWGRFLPGASSWYGPPRRWATVAEYARAKGLPTWAVEPPETVPAPAPVLFGPVDDYYLWKTPQTIPEKTVVRLRGACLYGPDGSIVTADDTFLWDSAWHEGSAPERTFPTRSLFQRRRPRPRHRLGGLTAVLTSDWAIGGFAHFLTDSLPRWRLLLAAGFRAGDFSRVALFHPTSPTSRRLIAAAGIPEDRIVAWMPEFDIECESMAGTTFPGAVPAISPASISWLRGLAGKGASRERVYISRAGYARHPANSAELEAELSRRGFAFLHGDDGTSVLDGCGSARVVIGVEGSNLFNLCFARPGARVVLLLPGPDTIPYISFICQAAGMPVAIVPAEPGSPPAAPVFPAAAVKAALDWAEEARP